MAEEYWQKQIAESHGDILVEVITDIKDGQDKIEEDLGEVKESIKNIEGAFPDGDLAGHKRCHEVMIKIYEEKRQLRKAVQEKTISGLVWAGILLFSAMMYNELESIIHYIARRPEE